MNSHQVIDKNAAFVHDYLAYLNLSIETPSIQYLKAIVKAHLEKIPYDGSDFALHQSSAIPLKKRAILDFFRSGHGSHCFHMHGALKKLLNLLGFTTIIAQAHLRRFDRHQHSDPIPTHVVLLVNFDNVEYLVDVSYGNGLREPVCVNGAGLAIPGEFPKRCVSNNGQYEEQVYIDDQWLTEYEFKAVDNKLRDLGDVIEWVTRQAGFVSTHLLLLRFMPDVGMECTVKNIYKDKNTLFKFNRISYQGERSEYEIDNLAELDDKLQEFGVDEVKRKSIYALCQ